jgi:hypothetical protein
MPEKDGQAGRHLSPHSAINVKVNACLRGNKGGGWFIEKEMRVSQEERGSKDECEGLGVKAKVSKVRG